MQDYDTTLVRDPRNRYSRITSTLPRATARALTPHEFRERCRQFMNEEGWQKLVEIIRYDERANHRFRALELIAAYAYGRPPQFIASDPEFAPIRLAVSLRPEDVAALAEFAASSETEDDNETQSSPEAGGDGGAQSIQSSPESETEDGGKA